FYALRLMISWIASTIFGVHYPLRNIRICQTVLRRRLPISAGAAGSLDIISGATTLLIRASSALGFAAAKIFVDANFSTVALEQSLGGIFATGAGTPGDGKVYITKSGSNLIS
ncbi:hypothetical protein V7P28_37005, partial [Klebsiella michiganensis]